MTKIFFGAPPRLQKDEKTKKEITLYKPKGDNRFIASILGNVDIVGYTESAGLDEKGEQILSTLYLIETQKFSR